MQSRLPAGIRVAGVAGLLLLGVLFRLPTWIGGDGPLVWRVAATTAAVLPMAPVDPSDAAPRKAAVSLADWKGASIGGLNRQVFALALGAASCAIRAGAVADPSSLTVIDYSKPSTSERLWVFDLYSRHLVYRELVAHGQGSGGHYATAFSNLPQTHRSSIGLFVTDETYVGTNGYSLRLDGLEAGYNDRARARAIVMHGASYVSAAFARVQGRLGRSWGCPAVRPAVARRLIDRIKGGNLVFVYYPDRGWLQSSRYLGDCDAAD